MPMLPPSYVSPVWIHVRPALHLLAVLVVFLTIIFRWVLTPQLLVTMLHQPETSASSANHHALLAVLQLIPALPVFQLIIKHISFWIRAALLLQPAQMGHMQAISLINAPPALLHAVPVWVRPIAQTAHRITISLSLNACSTVPMEVMLLMHPES